MYANLDKLLKKMTAESNPDARFTIFARGIAAEIKQIKNDPEKLQAFADDLHRETPLFVKAQTEEKGQGRSA